MKKIICFLLSVILIFALVGCNSDDSDNAYNEDDYYEEDYIEDDTDTSTQEDVIEKTTKKLIDFAPTYKELLQKMVDAGIVSGSTKAEFLENEGRTYASLTYKESGHNAYMIYLYFDSNDKVTGVTARTIGNYDLTDETFSPYLEYFPNSLYEESNIVEYVKTNGKKNDNKIKSCENGITYTYSSEYWDKLNSNVQDFIIEIAPNHEVENT